MPVYVDISRCIGCRACEVACQREHSGLNLIYVDHLHDRPSIPVVCHHCTESPCALICPYSALTQNGEVVTFNVEKCTGCGLCRLACPFGVMWTDKLAHKCDLCGDAEVPVCVRTCPAKALSKDYETVANRTRARAAMAIAKGVRT